MAEEQLSFPAEGPEDKPDNQKTKIKIRLRSKKQPDGKSLVTQVEVTPGTGPTKAFPDPPAGEGTPPTEPPKISTPDSDLTVVRCPAKPGDEAETYWFAVVCSLDPPIFSFHRRYKGPDGKMTEEVNNYIIDHATQDVLVSWLKDPAWQWGAPAPAHKGE